LTQQAVSNWKHRTIPKRIAAAEPDDSIPSSSAAGGGGRPWLGISPDGAFDPGVDHLRDR